MTTKVVLKNLDLPALWAVALKHAQQLVDERLAARAGRWSLNPDNEEILTAATNALEILNGIDRCVERKKRVFVRQRRLTFVS